MKAILPIIAFFVKKGKFKSFVKGQLGGIPKTPLKKDSKRYWFHCASLGEFEQARPLMEAIKLKNPDHSIVITFFSPSGYQQKQDYNLADKVLYLPLDTPLNAKRLQNYLQVDVAIFVKYEIWYHHLQALMNKNIPVFLVSAVFRKKQFLFSPIGRFLFRLLPQFNKIFVQDIKSFRLLKKKKLKNITLSGDTRYDRVKQNALNIKFNPFIEQFKNNKPLLVLGSSWQVEEQIVLDWLKTGYGSEFKIMIAPHDISENHIKEIQYKFNDFKPIRYTGNKINQDSHVLILDTIGHLASAYYYADMAFIGGGFGKGLHNILEALAFGVPVVFGDHIQKYPEAKLAIDSNIALCVQNKEDISKAIDFWFQAQKIESVKIQCTDFIHIHSGASDTVLKSL